MIASKNLLSIIQAYFLVYCYRMHIMDAEYSRGTIEFTLSSSCA